MFLRRLSDETAVPGDRPIAREHTGDRERSGARPPFFEFEPLGSAISVGPGNGAFPRRGGGFAAAPLTHLWGSGRRIYRSGFTKIRTAAAGGAALKRRRSRAFPPRGRGGFPKGPRRGVI